MKSTVRLISGAICAFALATPPAFAQTTELYTFNGINSGTTTYDASQVDGVRSLNDITSEIPLANSQACGPECANLQAADLGNFQAYYGDQGVYATAVEPVSPVVDVTPVQVATPVEVSKPVLPASAPSYESVGVGTGSKGLGRTGFVVGGLGLAALAGGLFLILDNDDDDDAAPSTR